MNKCMMIISGNVGKDPEFRLTPNGKAVCNFSIASKIGYGDHAKTEWTDCVAWGKLAELINEYVTKGKPVCLTGQKETRKWEDRDGNTRYKVECKVDDIEWFGKAENTGQNTGQNSGQNSGQQQQPFDDEGSQIPF